MESFVKAPEWVFPGEIWVEGPGGTHEGPEGRRSLRLNPDSGQ